MLFRCMSVPFIGEDISRHSVKPYPWKVEALTEMSPLKTKKELQTFCRINF